MPHPKVSICIPTYKQVEFLRHTFQSIAEQDFTDFELIITDDSPDESVKNLLSSFSFGKKLQYYKNPKALGSPQNWNEAISKAKGEYIKIMHHDDWFTNPQALTKFVELLDTNPQSDFGFSATKDIHAHNQREGIHQATSEQLAELRQSPEILFIHNIIGAPSTTIYRARLHQLYDANIAWVVDIDFYIRALQQNPQVAYIPDILIATTHSAKHQVTQTFTFKKKLEVGEYIYLFNKIYHPNLDLNRYRLFWARLFRLYNVRSFNDLAEIGIEKFVPRVFFEEIISFSSTLPSLQPNLLHRVLQKSSRATRHMYTRLQSPRKKSAITVPYKQSNDIFIFTEIYRCGKIGKIAIDSFCKYHPHTSVHVFGVPDDFKILTPYPNLILVDLSTEKRLLKAFDRGHRGTAMLWARIITERAEKYMIHFDSDVIFRAESLSDITKALKITDLVGYTRHYKNNPNNRDDVRHLPDVVQTAFFGFNKDKISRYSLNTLVKMCQGSYNPLGHPIIDFFDPVMFDMIKNGATLTYLSAQDYGGYDQTGKRAQNNYTELNKLIDFGHKYIHFSAVGSGMNFYQNKEKIHGVPSSYKEYALSQYALFCKLFYNEDIDFKLNLERYHQLAQILTS